MYIAWVPSGQRILEYDWLRTFGVKLETKNIPRQEVYRKKIVCYIDYEIIPSKNNNILRKTVKTGENSTQRVMCPFIQNWLNKNFPWKFSLVRKYHSPLSNTVGKEDKPKY